jgi:hypothetical protein
MFVDSAGKLLCQAFLDLQPPGEGLDKTLHQF